MDDTTKRAASAAARIDQDPESISQKSGDGICRLHGRFRRPGRINRWPDKKTLPHPRRPLTAGSKNARKTIGAPRLLEVPNEALVTNAGPLQITGNITLVTEDGSVQYANHLTLCRCGHSGSKPNCNGQHLDKEFLNSGKISEASEISASQNPSKITISCIKEWTDHVPGPLAYAQPVRAGMRKNARVTLPLWPVGQQAVL